MSSRGEGRAQQLRQRIAEEAARAMVEGGIRDFQLAKRKAVERLGLGATRQLPRNEEIERAREAYLRLFRGERQGRRLAEMRAAAADAMRFLAPFRPRLVGPVLSGSADENSEVSLHLFAQPAEEVGFFLMDRGIGHQTGERRVRVGGNDTFRLPTYLFIAGDVPVELVVFDEVAAKRCPLSPVDGRPMQRATLAEVEALAASGG